MVQLAHHLNFFMKFAEPIEVKVLVAEERAVKIKKELYKVETNTMEVEEVFRYQKEYADTLSSGAICTASKIRELQQKIVDARNGEARANADMKAVVVDLERKYQAKIKDLKEEVDGRIQLFWDELN